MKYYQLYQIAKFLQEFSFVNSISRVDDNTLQIRFDKKMTIYIDLKRSNSTIFMCENLFISKSYQAPFDIALQKRFTKTKINSISTLGENRVLQIKVSQESGYKVTNSTLLLEFTGRNTNAIILDENSVVIEALRHIDSSVSYRQVKVGSKLEPLPPHTLKEKPEPIEDIKEFLYDIYTKRQEQNLENLKTGKRLILHKKIAKLEDILKKLDSEEELNKEASTYQTKATLLLSNKHDLKDFQKNIILTDFDGKSIEIVLDKKIRSIQEAIDSFFLRGKKLRQRANSLHIERESLLEKLSFLQRLDSLLIKAKNEEEVNVLLPKQSLKAKRENDNDAYLTFFAQDYKIMVGKNQKGNLTLLKLAKKNDIWMHVKDIPSAHTIIKTDKINLPENIIEFAAKLCVNLSNLNSGGYLVDYTQRRNVKPNEGANVTYVNYKTIKVFKD